ncbi:DUF488 domain-containing protein [Candidatus Nomurabacteria bacterium]|nr:DUF488 domain-containing protein [Candidatus Nomurabacteria bacterium]
MIKTKSIFESLEANDGRRILITYAWPKNYDRKNINSWLKELGHPWELVENWPKTRMTWEDFETYYLKMLEKPRLQMILKELKQESLEKDITLLGLSRLENKCHRKILKEYLENLKIES